MAESVFANNLFLVQLIKSSQKIGILAAITSFTPFSTIALAQFVGPTPRGINTSVEAARTTPIDTYIILTGSIIAHLLEDYYTFRDETGDIRVEISDGIWPGQPVTPKNIVRLVAEVERNSSGLVYLWVKSLEIVK
ncbi:MAG: YgiW/YdeI family stress tolerance OB fold protein [Xenococcus sp. (in: cyanobacteria)]